MASKILTEQEARNIGYTGTATANLLCTYARAKALGCTAKSGYSFANNQLVYEGSLQQAEHIDYYYLTIASKSCSTAAWNATSSTISYTYNVYAHYAPSGSSSAVVSGSSGSTSYNWGSKNTNSSATTASPSFTASNSTYGVSASTTVSCTHNGIGHAYVTLGGKKWATVNIGASSATGYGSYYAWTGTDPATSVWGSPWRTPTRDEWASLLSSTSHSWTTQDGVKGVKFTSGSTSMFVPAAGAYENNAASYIGSMITYWSSTDYNTSLQFIFYGNSSSHAVSTFYDYHKLTVRAIADC